MLFKLSLKNIKKSLKDYSIYFFTLVIAVCIFYIFNSMDSQNSMLVLTQSKRDMVKSIVVILGYISVFVSVILGFLIIYSNNFLIKRRKKEIGLYLTLGMSKRKVSLVLVLETLIVGIFSLAIGLLIGIGLSQFLSVFTAKIFEANMTAYKFVFSSSALYKTILYFGIIFVLVMIFNIISLSKYKLIDLLTANRKNEQVKMRNKYVTFITFILAMGFLIYAYKLLFDGVLFELGNEALVMIICGAIGTFLFFFSVSGFLLKVFQKVKNVYYKGLNMFVLKQVNNKINTSVISTTIISLMLLLTIGILSGSISLVRVFNQSINENNLTDYSVSTNFTNDNYKINDKEYFIKFDEIINDKNLSKYTNDYTLVHRYLDSKLLAKDFITDNSMKELRKKYGDMINVDFQMPIISETDYKDLMKLQNKTAIDIDDNEYLLLSNVEEISNLLKQHYESKIGIIVNNTKLLPGSDKIISVGVENSVSNNNDGLIVISDYFIKELDLTKISLIGNYVENNDIEKMNSDFESYLNNYMHEEVYFITKTKLQGQSVGLKAMIIFIGLYLGIIFAISSATILAIGQLSESSDNKDRYKILKQIGADDNMIKKSLFTQISIAFGFPLVVALFHSFFGLRELNQIIKILGNIDLTSNIFITSMFILIIYGGYMIVTYLCSKNIIKN